MTETIKRYILLTKPGIVCGNLISVAGGFLLASRGSVDTGLLLATIIGVSLVIASGCVFNNYIDRDMDRIMGRTRMRVLPRELIAPRAAVFYASLLGVAGVVLLWAATNTLCVAIVLSGFTIYAAIYSLYLKRKSVYATLIGSLAGAAPPLAGYCAVTDRFDMGALILLSIFSLWQIPHSYAIAIYHWQDFAAAAIPAYPVKQGIPAAKRHSIVYIMAFMAATLMLTLGNYTGYNYLMVAVAMGLFWLRMARSGFRNSDDRTWARRMFVFSILTIIVLNVMMSVDAVMPVTPPHCRLSR